MRSVPSSLQNLLDSGATTLARCWRIERSDGQVFGFTDHDAPLEFEGIAFEPDSGFTASSAEASTGLAPGSHDISGILTSDQINTTDLIKGLFSGAEVSVFLVNWADPSSRLLLSRGQIGGIKRNGSAFEAEIIGLSDRLNQPLGRAYVHSCECRLGDAKCGVDLGNSALFGNGTVESMDASNQFHATGLQSFADGWFTGGEILWQSGGNAGLRSHVKAHQSGAATGLLEIWLTPEMPIGIGDSFSVTAGCDKTVSECRAKFNNLLNFRGFPHMPGDDVLTSYPSTDGGHNGGSLLR